MASANDLRKYRVEIPNLYDDSELDPYQFRVLVHIVRRGVCYENDRALAESCQMSAGKANEVKKWLIKQGWVEYTIVPNTGQKGLRAVDKWAENLANYQKTEQKNLASETEDCSPHEQSIPNEQDSPNEKQRSPHERHLKKEPKQEELLAVEPPAENGDGTAKVPIKEKREILTELEKHFSQLSRLAVPKRQTEKQRKEAAVVWWNPLWEMYELTHNLAATKRYMSAAYGKMKEDKLTVSSPKSILNNVKSAFSANGGVTADEVMTTDNGVYV